MTLSLLLLLWQRRWSWHLMLSFALLQIQLSVEMPPHIKQRYLMSETESYAMDEGFSSSSYNDELTQGIMYGSTKKMKKRMLQKEEKNIFEQKLKLKHSKNLSDAQRLRRDLLKGYDKGAYPWSYAWEKSTSVALNGEGEHLRKGVEVELGLNFHRVFQVDVSNSVADLVVWLRQQWTDPRLTWEPEHYGNLTKIWFWIGDGSGMAGETSEIWTPDLELWNLETSLADSMVDAAAVVSHTGNVFWSRPGHIRPVCRFTGLEEFPFDELGCTLEIGSWAYSGLYLRPIKYGEGYSVGGSETAGESYAEYSLTNVSCEEYVYPPYPSDPESDWPVVMYHVSFARAWHPYVRGYLLLQIILNVVAFACFWLPPHCGERMGLAITAMLAAVASDLVVAEKLPSANEFTWFAEFSMGSTIFASAVLFESAAVIYFHYHTGPDLFPPWMKFLFQTLIKTYKLIFNNNKHSNNNNKSNPKPSNVKESSPGSSYNNNEKHPLVSSDEDEVSNTDLSSKGSKSIRFAKTNSIERNGVISTVPAEESSSNINDESSSSSSSDDDAFDNENVDNESSSKLKKIKKHKKKMKKRDQASFQRRRFGIDQNKSLDAIMTNSFRNRVTVSMGRDADDFKSKEEVINNAKWQMVGRKIDEYSRLLFPVAFTIFVSQTFIGIV